LPLRVEKPLDVCFAHVSLSLRAAQSQHVGMIA
jgi:hypothetical protein